MSIPVITIEQMRAWEHATWATGVTAAEVIERVGSRVAEQALRMTQPGDFIAVLAGRGHNGDDARACLPHLSDRRTELLNIQEPARAISGLEKLLSQKPELIIDGIFGIGLNRPLDAEWIAILERINAEGLDVLSVDVPSGLNADTGETWGAAIRATTTLTVEAVKVGLLQEPASPWIGRVEVASNVGLTLPCPVASELTWAQPDEFAGFPPRRIGASHKGSYGHLAIVAGSLGYHGAAVLAAKGAQRARPGLITLHTLDQVYPVIAAQLQAVMVSILETENKLPGPWTAFLIGPGMVQAPDHVKMLARSLWKDAMQPVVVDASALDWLPMETVPKNAVRVMTPHPGEAGRLLRITPQQVQANRLGALRRISKQYGNAWVVLKGDHTLIGRATGEVCVNSSGNPYLAQGGSGDVLAGFLAGLLAQPRLQNKLEQAIRYAVWQHGAAADRLENQRRNWVVEDLTSAIGDVRAREGSARQ